MTANPRSVLPPETLIPMVAAGSAPKSTITRSTALLANGWELADAPGWVKPSISTPLAAGKVLPTTIRCGPVPGMLNAIVSLPAALAAAGRACRNVQLAAQLLPAVSAVDVTVNVAACPPAATNASNSHRMRIGQLPLEQVLSG